jgi:DNA polymerase-3 subunit alpha
LRLTVTDAAAVPSIAARIEAASVAAGPAGARGSGPVRLVLVHRDLPGEVEIELQGRHPATPAVARALKDVQGVALVEEI